MSDDFGLRPTGDTDPNAARNADGAVVDLSQAMKWLRELAGYGCQIERVLLAHIDAQSAALAQERARNEKLAARIKDLESNEVMCATMRSPKCGHDAKVAIYGGALSQLPSASGSERGTGETPRYHGDCPIEDF